MVIAGVLLGIIIDDMLVINDKIIHNRAVIASFSQGQMASILLGHISYY